MDEINVKCGVAYNASTEKESGFTASNNKRSLKFAEEILSIAEESIGGEESTEGNVEDIATTAMLSTTTTARITERFQSKLTYWMTTHD